MKKSRNKQRKAAKKEQQKKAAKEEEEKKKEANKPKTENEPDVPRLETLDPEKLARVGVAKSRLWGVVVVVCLAASWSEYNQLTSHFLPFSEFPTAVGRVRNGVSLPSAAANVRRS